MLGLLPTITETNVPAVTELCDNAVIGVPSAVVVLLFAIAKPALAHVNSKIPAVEEILPKP